MTRVRPRGEDIRKFILENVTTHSSDIAKFTSAHFGISRQAVAKHLSKLVDEKCLSPSGNTRNRTYRLVPLVEWQKVYPITGDLAEDMVWTEDVSSALGNLPSNVRDIWHYCFTEMFNNAIDHSGGTTIFVEVIKTASTAEMLILDDGIGIFRKIQEALHLLDERHAVLELSKGKLTTDPRNHTGEGIFFSSRLMDSFQIHSGGVHLSHKFGDDEDWILENSEPRGGTAVFLRLHNHTSRTEKQVFDQYVSGNDYAFTKTVVPVRLAQYGNDKLVSRSQAKRVLARVELFKTILFDFTDVDSVGPAFADEIFRVFADKHPEIEMHPIHVSPQIRAMIARAESVEDRSVQNDLFAPDRSGSEAGDESE
jgi:hypothetical protein